MVFWFFTYSLAECFTSIASELRRITVSLFQRHEHDFRVEDRTLDSGRLPKQFLYYPSCKSTLCLLISLRKLIEVLHFGY